MSTTSLPGRSFARVDERAVLAFAALLATAAAWAFFAMTPPMAVRVGRDAIDLPVPVHYQIAVAPAFGACCGALLLDLMRGRAWAGRAAVLGLTSGLAVVRLLGQIALSGHALFLFAALAFEVAPPPRKHAPLVAAMVIPGLLVTAWYKLVVWEDPLWFVASAALGAALGALLARRRPVRR